VTIRASAAKLDGMNKKNSHLEPFFDIPYYHDYLSPELARHLLAGATPVRGVSGLSEVGSGGGLETTEALGFLVELYGVLQPALARLLRNRAADRKFMDERVKACYEYNRVINRDFSDHNYKTIIGLEDADGRIVIGPKSSHYCAKGGEQVAPIPEFLRGPHVTLFGPPDSVKLSINAMNAYHRKLKGEPKIVEDLLASQTFSPKWGADDEDSKTPLRQDLIESAVNLTACFEGTLTLKEEIRTYELAKTRLSAPLKRFPGLALPSTFLFYNGKPLPLHLYDFALHIFQNWHNPESLTFYVPKLENEEEARYIHQMISTAEAMVKARNPSYTLGTVRVMIVLENPRAILRTHEIMDELFPYFVGASLGWHDYLASTARLFKEDANYRIPVKVDPNIVIKYIKASHSMLADVVGSRGGIKVGGMYGILPLHGDLSSPSFQVTLKGYFKDVITQLKRDLTGFWVAHPDFVRLGLAIVEAWNQHQKGQSTSLFTLTKEIFSDGYREEVDQFIRGDDIAGLDPNDPNYVRALLVADIKVSDTIANNHPDEIRYNVFQSLQYLTDWLCGNGCVALPTIIDGIPVRVMDDLATAERSRWEVWHEIYHGRFAVEEFLTIAHEEMRFIRKDLSDTQKIVQVKWDERTSKWYPVAFKIMIQLMTAKKPVEFATELLMPFTVDEIRRSPEPWTAATKIDGRKFQVDEYTDRWNYYFERCGCPRFAREMAGLHVTDLAAGEASVMSFSKQEMMQAASFHGDIGESPKTLDHQARNEQHLVSVEESSIKSELKAAAASYLSKFGFKFLVSASGRSAKDLLTILQARLNHTPDQEITNAKEALWQIARKRILERDVDSSTTGILDELTALAKKYRLVGAQIAVANPFGQQTFCIGEAVKGQRPVTTGTLFELASLSKTVATAFACDYFASRNILLSQPVNELLASTKSPFRLATNTKTDENAQWADEVTIAHLMSHNGLNMHYVKGFTTATGIPAATELLLHGPKHGYEPVDVISKPGTKFQYSGAGFIVLEHLIESLEGLGGKASKSSIQELTAPYLRAMGLSHLTFQQNNIDAQDYADGYFDDDRTMPGGRLLFPAFAAGAMGTATDMLSFLRHLGKAFSCINGSGGIRHDTAVLMLHGRDRGCREFMGCDMGLGVFVAEMGDNRVAIHQGANDGFRAIYIYVFSGPDTGKGFVILCNADNRGVMFISEVARVLLKSLNMTGLDFSKVTESFDYSRLSQEQIVNLGYKHLIFNAFESTLPEKIVIHGPRCRLADCNLLTEARILTVSNQKFARAENLFSPYEPVFDPELFGRQGKIMDSWESVRHNELSCDTLDLKLKSAGEIQFVVISTKFHDGNQPQFVRLLGRSGAKDPWTEFVGKISMDGHASRHLRLEQPTKSFDEIRVEMYPDGGLTRVGLYGALPETLRSGFVSVSSSKCVRFSDEIPKTRKPLTIAYLPRPDEVLENLKRVSTINAPCDYACAAFGGQLIRATNEHYGPAVQVISPYPPIHMFDGLESSRSRVPGHYEEVVVKLGRKIKIARIVIDFKFFTNNNPVAIVLFALVDGSWIDLSGTVPVKAFAANQKEILIGRDTESEQIMLRTLPDGGVNRIHVYESVPIVQEHIDPSNLPPRETSYSLSPLKPLHLAMLGSAAANRIRPSCYRESSWQSS
jgi:malate synthase